MRLRNYWTWRKFTVISERVFCDQFVVFGGMADYWKVVLGVRWWNFELKFGQ